MIWGGARFEQGPLASRLSQARYRVQQLRSPDVAQPANSVYSVTGCDLEPTHGSTLRSCIINRDGG